MKLVLVRPARKSGSEITASRNGMFVETPRTRNSLSARCARRAADPRSAPRQVSLTSIESKWALTVAPAKTTPPSSRTPAPPGVR